MKKKIAEGTSEGTPPPPSPLPRQSHPGALHPQSRVSAKALESLLKLFCCGMLYPLCARTPDRRIYALVGTGATLAANENLSTLPRQYPTSSVLLRMCQ